jgi:hypothetical protein
MKATSKTIHSADQLIDDQHDHDHYSHGHGHDQDHDLDHETGTAEYVRLGLMGIIVIASGAGWWRQGAFPIPIAVAALTKPPWIIPSKIGAQAARLFHGAIAERCLRRHR